MVSDRDRASAKVFLQERDAYVQELTRRRYSEAGISRLLERHDEMYGSTPFFEREQ